MYEEISTNKHLPDPSYDSAGAVYGKSFLDLKSQNLHDIDHQPHQLKESFIANQELECNLDKDYNDCISIDIVNVQERGADESSLESADAEENDDDKDEKTSQEEDVLSQSEEEEYPHLSIDDVLNKVHEIDMTEDSVLMGDVRNIGSDNLEKLQTLNRSNHMIKRLLNNNRLTSREVKHTTIDPDIKSAVSEFIKTNVVGNFIISRVLRENYATFYGWLATHLQCERNSWLVRLNQTLNQYEVLRRDNIGQHDVIIDSAQKVEMLLQFCSQSITWSSNREHGNSIQKVTSLQPLSSLFDNFSSTPENKDIATKVKSQSKQCTSPKISSSLLEAVNTDINGGETQTTRESYNSDNCQASNEVKIGTVQHGRHVKSVAVQSTSTAQFKDKTYNSRIDDSSLHFDNATDSINKTKQSIVGIEDFKCKDWKEALRNGFQQLEEMCEYFVLDRNECLKYIGANSSGSLTEAVSAFVIKRETSGQSERKEIEQRLSLLETENKELINEMATLQNLLSDKQKDALNLQKQLDKLEKMLSNATCDKLHKCIGTDDTESTQVSNNSYKQINPHGNKVNQTPYRYKMMSTNKTTQKGSKEKETNIQGIRRLEPETRDLKVNRDVFSLPQKFSEKHNNMNSVESETNNGHTLVKEKSLIEISEEKLKILKQRAQKLENSLHDAISSMTLMHKKKEDCESSFLQSDSTHVMCPPSKGNHTMKSLANTLHVKGSSPRLAVIRRPMSQGRSQSETLLISEPTSFLTGRSVALTSHNPTDRSLAQSVLTVMVDKHKSDIQTKRDYEHYITSKYNNRELGLINYTNKEQDTTKAVKAKVISRHRATSNGMVSKCLRCQKLFCAVDNHKLACFFHTKDKERIEHYDQTGKLLRVAQVWMCCHQPQEIEGCCYGQHI